MLRDQISATRIVINSSLIRDWKLPSLLVCIRDCHPRLARATNWNCSPGSPLPLRGSSSSPNFKRYCGRKKSVVAIFAPIALFAVSSPALHCTAPHRTPCTAHSTKVPHFLIRRRRRRSVRSSARYIWMFSQAFFGERLRARVRVPALRLPVHVQDPRPALFKCRTLNEKEDLHFNYDARIDCLHIFPRE